MAVACPKCKRNVPEKRACMYCGAVLGAAPPAAAATGASAPPMGARQWVAEGGRLAQAGELERAVSCFDQAIRIEPRNFFAWFNRSVMLANLGRLREALAGLDEALATRPGDREAQALRDQIRRDPRFVLPPGRPFKSLIEMLVDGGPAEAFVGEASTALQTRLKRFSGPEEIAGLNWIVQLPTPALDPAGRPIWEPGELQRDGVLFHLLLRDGRVFAFVYEGEGHEIADPGVPRRQLEAYGALLESRTVARIGLGANRPFAPSIVQRVDSLNRKLLGLGLPEPQRVELLLVPRE